MQKRQLGTGGLTVSAMGIGAMGLTGTYNAPVDTAAAIALLQGAEARGITHFDTAEAYGPFTNETLLGRAFQG